MNLNDLFKKIDKTKAEFLDASIDYQDETIHFLVKSRAYAADDEHIWIKRSDPESMTEGLQRRIHRLVRVQDDDGLEEIPLDDIEMYPFDLLVLISEKINEIQGIEIPVDDEDEDTKKKPDKNK